MGTFSGPTTLYALAETAAGSIVNGSAYSILGSPQAILANVTIYAAQVNTTAPSLSITTSPPNRIVLQGSQYSSDDTKWADLYAWNTGNVASHNTTLNGGVSAGATTATLTGSGTFGA